MRLYLSSQGLGDHADRLLEMVGENKKTLLIDNAKDYLPVGERAEHVRLKKQELEQVGLEAEELDLRDYFEKKDGLEKRLEGVGLVFAYGGSAFILRRAMRYSGFDDLLVEGLMHDRFTYGGSSAGSVVMVPDLHGTELADEPDLVPAHYEREVVWKGLGLVDFYVVPHYLSDWFGDKANAMKRYYEEKQLPHHALMDGQVYVAEGTHQELLS